MSDIHIEGMGLLGSMLARRLAEEGVPFTWSDTDTFSAWPISTGLAYPDGHDRGEAGRLSWHGRLDVTPEAAEVPFVYAHKSPPHDARYAVEVDYGTLRMAEPRAVALNVRAFVENTREMFDDRHVAASAVARVVVAHTTPERGAGATWGWAARVKLDLPDYLAADLLGERPALYAKAHRFDLTYAYPIPGTDLYWAGSAQRVQNTPARVEEPRLGEYVDTWLGNAALLLGVRNVEVVEVGQGWRPRAQSGDSGHVERNPAGWSLPPMGPNGMRMGWLVVEELVSELVLL